MESFSLYKSILKDQKKDCSKVKKKNCFANWLEKFEYYYINYGTLLDLDPVGKMNVDPEPQPYFFGFLVLRNISASHRVLCLRTWNVWVFNIWRLSDGWKRPAGGSRGPSTSPLFRTKRLGATTGWPSLFTLNILRWEVPSNYRYSLSWNCGTF